MLRYKGLGIFLLIVTYSSLVMAEVIYVDASAMGNCDGTSWVDACVDLQDGLLLAQSGDEIWVAAGTYKPDRGSGDRTASFELKGGVTLFGGFAGWETASFQRIPEINQTILSGDLNGDDNPNGSTDAGTSNCCFTRLDELGCDDAACEAIVCSIPGRESCCNPVNLLADWSVGCSGSAEALCGDLCSNKQNGENSISVVTAENIGVEAVFDGFTVQSGNANINSPFVGGNFTVDTAIVAIRDCVFFDGAAYKGAGGLYVADSTLTIERCLFTANDGVFSGPGAMALIRSGATINETTFLENTAGNIAGVVISNSSPVFRNCVFDGNVGGGVGAMSVGNNGSPSLIGCTFINNVALNGLPSAIDCFDCSITIINSSFIGNSGGALNLAFSAGAIIINCLFTGHYADEPMLAIVASVSNSFISNCTFVNNTIPAIYTRGTLNLRNSVFWGNLASFGGIDNTTVSYSALEDLAGLQQNVPSIIGVGNTDADPLFVDLLGPDGIAGTADDDLRLSAASPLINQGDPMPSVAAFADLDGHTRKLCGRLDMGVYEFGIGDFDCNQTVNLTDFANWATCMTDPNDATASASCQAFDYDADDDIDLTDFAAFSTAQATSP